MRWTTDDLLRFVGDAHKNSYANTEAEKTVSCRPDSKDYHFEKDGFVYHDTYFGGQYFIGEEVVYFEDKAIWGMNYYGRIFEGFDVDEVSAFLKESLMKEVGDMVPTRGPKEHIKGEWQYGNFVQGVIEKYLGMEKIYKDRVLVYESMYHGGIIQ